MAYELKDSQGNHVLKDGKQVYAADQTSVVKGVDMEKRTLSIVGTTEAVDRDGDIIRVKGWQYDNYLKNPVFIWGHNYAGVPIGGTRKMFRRRDPQKHIEHLVRFPSREGLYPFADMVLELYHERIINASSVGFFPMEMRRRKPVDGDAPGKGKDDDVIRIERVGYEYLKQELLELSGCSVPSNPEALQNMLKGFGSIDEKQKEWFVRMATEWEEPKNIDDIREELYQLSKDEIEVYDEDGKTTVFISNKTGQTLCTFEDVTTGDHTNGDDISKEDYLKEEGKPYPNEHACRLNSPDKYDRFARKNCEQKHDGKCIDVIYGVKGSTSEIQALRFKKDVWTAAAARSVCNARDGSFEAASSDSRQPGESLRKVWDEFHKNGLVLREFDEQVKFIQRVNGKRNLPLAEKDTPWHLDSAWNRLGNALFQDPAYRTAFVWADAPKYDFMIADYIDDQLKVVFAAVKEAMDKLNKGTSDIPDEDRFPIYQVLCHYYERFEEEPPEFVTFCDLARSLLETLRHGEKETQDAWDSYWQKVLEGVKEPNETPSAPIRGKDKDDKGTQSVDAFGMDAEQSSWLVEQIRAAKRLLRKS